MEIDQAVREAIGVAAVYSDRRGVEMTDEWLFLKATEELGELTRAFLALRESAAERGAGELGIGRLSMSREFGPRVTDLSGPASSLRRRRVSSP